jgi:hypothetical protein
LLLGAFVYWTLALGLGAVSLSGFQAFQHMDWELSIGAAPLSSTEEVDADLVDEATTDGAGEALGAGTDEPTAQEGTGSEAIPVEVVGATRDYTPGVTAF